MTPSSSPKRSHTSLPKKLNFEDGIPVEVIIWLDATYDTTDDAYLDDTSEFGKLHTCIDAGMVVRETKNYVVMAIGGAVDDNTVRHSNTIPKSLIVARIPMGLAQWTLPNTPQKKLSPKSAAKTSSSTGSTSTSTPTSPSTGPNSTTDARRRPSQ